MNKDYILAIDIGNTNIVFGLMKKKEVVDSFRITTDDSVNALTLYNLLSIYYKNIGYIDSISYAMVTSVVPKLNDILKEALDKLSINYSFVNPVEYEGLLSIGLENKEELGADLFVGSYEATKKYGSPNIVIDMGTATTIAVVNENTILGGIIYPGVVTAFKDLTTKAALLDKVEFNIPSCVIGKNTKESLQSGMIFGTVGMLKELIERIKENVDNPKIILTGGISKYFEKYIENAIYDENLLLEGLIDLYEDGGK